MWSWHEVQHSFLCLKTAILCKLSFPLDPYKQLLHERGHMCGRSEQLYVPVQSWLHWLQLPVPHQRMRFPTLCPWCHMCPSYWIPHLSLSFRLHGTTLWGQCNLNIFLWLDITPISSERLLMGVKEETVPSKPCKTFWRHSRWNQTKYI